MRPLKIDIFDVEENVCFVLFNVCFKSIVDAQASNFGKILDYENFEI